MTTIELAVAPLSADGFAIFGDVITADGDSQLINRGTTQNFADLARVEMDYPGGRPRVSLYRAAATDLPCSIAMLERHPLSSQLFMPLHGRAFLIVVAPPGDTIEPSAVQAFVTNRFQGVNYRPGTWHHPVLAIDSETDFLVVDREGPGDNCDEIWFTGQPEIILNYSPAAD